MNAFFLRSYREHQRQKELKNSFIEQTGRLAEIFKADERANERFPFEFAKPEQRFLLLLAPLVEVAWADGRVTRREMDTIIQAADIYSLVEIEPAYRELIGLFLSRPAPSTVGQMWQKMRRFFECLNETECETVTEILMAQTSFIAEQSSENLLAFLRGERVSDDEHEALSIVKNQLENARNAVAARAEIQKPEEKHPLVAKTLPNYSAEDYAKLVPLVPLVKTAWAEGRVTKRERQLIFEAAARFGIKTDSTAFQRLNDWLELHPTEEFYDTAFDDLRKIWETLPEDEKHRQKFDLLSDCTRIAEASGGSKKFSAGGAKICPEEITAVKQIAKRLNRSAETAN